MNRGTAAPGSDPDYSLLFPRTGMYLGIEIGGTKLQLGVGSGDGQAMVVLERLDVDPQRGAEGIREQIQRLGKSLIERYEIAAIGVGFGGPVDADAGQTITSHQIDGWDGFALAPWCRRAFGLPTVLANDSDLAGLAEARFGAGQGHRVVFYTNIGSGIGGALVVDGQLYRGGSGVASELGHLRPGLQCDRADRTVESIASGWGIAAAARALLDDSTTVPSGPPADKDFLGPAVAGRRSIERQEAEEALTADLLRRCDGQVDRLTATMVARAATEGNRWAREIFDHACRTFGWAVAQMITLLGPDVVVLGGGVSLAGEPLVLAPVRQYVGRYVFPPLHGTFRIVPAQLGEEVVVHGALAIARGCDA